VIDIKQHVTLQQAFYETVSVVDSFFSICPLAYHNYFPTDPGQARLAAVRSIGNWLDQHNRVPICVAYGVNHREVSRFYPGWLVPTLKGGTYLTYDSLLLFGPALDGSSDAFRSSRPFSPLFSPH
jgi:hypothetical protein